MKKLLQKIVQMAVVIAVLCPSISSAEGSNILKGGGGLFAVIGAIGWYASNNTLDDCKAENADVDGVFCINHADLENRVNGFGGLTAIGVVAFAVGSILDKDSGFQVRPIQNGIAIERKGLSFSAAATGKVKLQKRWEF